MSEFIEEIAGFKLILDPYNGVTVEQNQNFDDVDTFEDRLLQLITQLKNEKRNLLWITFTLEYSHLIPIASKYDFTFHNCDEDYVMMVKELKANPIVPTSPTHTLGVGAVVINDNNEVLVIKERVSYNGYKLPGGHIDLAEKISDAVQREVLEETGVIVEFESVISLGHFHPHQFGKGNLYILCKCKALSSKIDIQDTAEIQEAKWTDVDKFINSEETFEFTKEIIKTTLNFDGMKIKDLESFKNFPKKYELFFPEFKKEKSNTSDYSF
jgi:8-oxo-dGTP diphosphatase